MEFAAKGAGARFLRAIRLAFIGITIGLTCLASTANAGEIVVSSADIPLNSGGDVAAFVHVVTRVVLGSTSDAAATITVHANLPASASAVGSDGTPVIITGASQHVGEHDISHGDIIPCIMPGFRVISTGEGTPPGTFDILLNLDFSSSGELLGGSAEMPRDGR